MRVNTPDTTGHALGKCPLCPRNLVSPSGPWEATIGIIGEFPGQEEKRLLAPFVGASGRILRTELKRVGIQATDCRLTNLWMHDPLEDDKEYDLHLKQAILAVKKCKIVLLLGSDASQAFLGEKVSNVAGLWLESDLLTNKRVIACPNPAALLHGTIGEFRLTMERLKKEMR